MKKTLKRVSAFASAICACGLAVCGLTACDDYEEECEPLGAFEIKGLVFEEPTKGDTVPIANAHVTVRPVEDFPVYNADVTTGTDGKFVVSGGKMDPIAKMRFSITAPNMKDTIIDVSMKYTNPDKYDFNDAGFANMDVKLKMKAK